MYMHTQVCSSFNKLVYMSYPESLLCLSYSFAFDGRSFFQNRWCCHFFKNIYLLWGCIWRRLWAHKGIIYSPKMDEICNKPSKNEISIYHSILIDDSNYESCQLHKSTNATKLWHLQRRKIQSFTDIILNTHSFSNNQVLNSWSYIV